MKSLISWLQRRPYSLFVKLLSGFVIISLALLIFVVIIIVTLENVGNRIKQADDLTRINNALQSLSRADSTSQIELYQLLLNFNSPLIAQTLSNNVALVDSEVVKARQQINTAFNNLVIIPDSYLSATDVKNFKAMAQGPINNLLNNLSDLIIDIKAGRTADALNKFNALKTDTTTYLQIETFMASLTPKLEAAIEKANNQSQNAITDANTSRSNSEIILIIAAILIVVLALAFGILLTFVFSPPIERLRRRFLSLADGDFVTPLVINNRDQFGELATTFNQTIAQLGGILDLLQTQSVRVSSAAAQIAATSRQSATLSAEQAGQVSEVAVTVEELSNTAQQIADAASLVSEAAEQALDSAGSGQDTLRETIVGINGVKARVQDIAVKILALTERSQQVGHVIEQINGIAEEIHLLALNAAIESAAAGENGKRFAVVAARVKQLADRSRNATREVQTVLSEIQAATNASVMATEQGMKEAERGVELVHRGGNANESIIQSVERTVQLASAISLATQQQRSASEQVVATMQQLTNIIQEGASSSRQSSSLAVELDGIANQLKQSSGQFKVDINKNNGAGPPTTLPLDEPTINLNPYLEGASDAGTPASLKPEPAR